MESWLDDVAGAIKLIIFFGILAFLYFLFASPKEEIGQINYDVLNSCSTSVTTERGSTENSFKTFTCTYGYLSGYDCYHMQIQNGACTKVTRYHTEETLDN